MYPSDTHLEAPIPVALFKEEVYFSFKPTVFRDGHPDIPSLCLTGVVLDEHLRTEMRRIPEPCPDEFTFITQQCNCVTLKPHGQSETIVQQDPTITLYSERKSMGRGMAKVESRGIPGTLYITGRIVCFLAQWRPGKIGSPYFRRFPESVPRETHKQREKWFQACLERLKELCQGPVTIAFPDHIGCETAGGDWVNYEKMISDFAQSLSSPSRVHVVKHNNSYPGCAW